MFPVYGGKCLSRKAVHNWVEKFSQLRSKVSHDETEVRKWLRQQSILLCCGVSKHWQSDGTSASNADRAHVEK
jgi:hypothetical protein